MRVPTDAPPENLLRFAREALYSYSGPKDADQLAVARRAMLRLSEHMLLPDYWIDRFGSALQELELAYAVGGHTPTAHAKCHKTLDALELEFD